MSGYRFLQDFSLMEFVCGKSPSAQRTLDRSGPTIMLAEETTPNAVMMVTGRGTGMTTSCGTRGEEETEMTTNFSIRAEEEATEVVAVGEEEDARGVA